MVKPGGTQRTPIGVLEFRTVTEVDEASITDTHARKAGEKDREALLRRLRPDGQIYRVELAIKGDDPRIALRNTVPTPQEIDEIAQRLARMDRTGPWTTA